MPRPFPLRQQQQQQQQQQQVHHIVRDAAVQAAAFANAMATRATRPSADWMRPSEDNARNRMLARQLTSSLRRDDSAVPVSPALQVASTTATTTNASSSAACIAVQSRESCPANDRRAFLEHLKSAAAKPSMVAAGTTPTMTACAPLQTSAASSCNNRPATQPPSSLHGKNWRNGITSAMRRLMG